MKYDNLIKFSNDVNCFLNEAFYCSKIQTINVSKSVSETNGTSYDASIHLDSNIDESEINTTMMSYFCGLVYFKCGPVFGEGEEGDDIITHYHLYFSVNEVINENKAKAERIVKFLEEYAVKNPNRSDDGDAEFTGPDASSLRMAADYLNMSRLDLFKSAYRGFSSWESGCYAPYSSTEGRNEHESIVDMINTIILGA